MILIFFKVTGNLFCRLFLSLGLTDASSWLDLSYIVSFGRNVEEIMLLFVCHTKLHIYLICLIASWLIWYLKRVFTVKLLFYSLVLSISLGDIFDLNKYTFLFIYPYIFESNF